jgi:hypothetical protein
LLESLEKRHQTAKGKSNHRFQISGEEVVGQKGKPSIVGAWSLELGRGVRTAEYGDSKLCDKARGVARDAFRRCEMTISCLMCLFLRV